jgi:hypothetical protein
VDLVEEAARREHATQPTPGQLTRQQLLRRPGESDPAQPAGGPGRRVGRDLLGQRPGRHDGPRLDDHGGEPNLVCWGAPGARTDQYGLLHTVDTALGLTPLTNNDRYAATVNDAWQ